MATKALNFPNRRNAPKLVRLQIKSLPEGPPQFCILHLDFCIFLHAVRSTNSYVRNYKPFLTNKANFPKSQMNVNKALTMDYEIWTLGERGKNKPNQSQSKPIQSQLKPIKCQNKPKQSQFQRLKMLLIFTLLEVLENSIMTGYYLEQHGSLNLRRLP